MASENDLIVFDEEYSYAANEIKGYCDALSRMIDSYSKGVNNILENAIRDEDITSRLQNIVSGVEALKVQIEALGSLAASDCTQYVEKIDAADQFLG